MRALTSIGLIPEMSPGVFLDERAIRTQHGILPNWLVREGGVEPPRAFAHWILGVLRHAGRWLLGLPPATINAMALAPEHVMLSLPLKKSEAEQEGKKRLSLEWDGKPDVVTVTIPPGIRPGTKLRVRGKGRPVPGGGRGDLYLVIELAAD